MLKELVMQRESTRGYLDTPVSRAVLADLVDTARMAPNTRNLQQWRFLICDGDAAKLVASTVMTPPDRPRWHEDCPAFILITTERPDPARTHDFAIADAAIAAAYLTLAAAEHGLGSCILGSCDENSLLKLFPAIGPGRRVELVVAVGYPKEPFSGRKERLPLGSICAFADKE